MAGRCGAAGLSWLRGSAALPSAKAVHRNLFLCDLHRQRQLRQAHRRIGFRGDDGPAVQIHRSHFVRRAFGKIENKRKRRAVAAVTACDIDCFDAGFEQFQQPRPFRKERPQSPEHKYNLGLGSSRIAQTVEHRRIGRVYRDSKRTVRATACCAP
jgi:hypothetical protein